MRLVPSLLLLHSCVRASALDLRLAELIASPGRPLMIAVAGGTASGKTSVVDRIVSSVRGGSAIASITQDCFYRPLAEWEREMADASRFNFDHPNAFDWELTLKVLKELKSGSVTPSAIPQYDFCTHTRQGAEHDTHVCQPQIVIFEGILALHDPELRDLFDLKVFVDADADLRLARRIRRDMRSRGRDLAGILLQYEHFVKPSFDSFILPSKHHADIVVPRCVRVETTQSPSTHPSIPAPPPPAPPVTPPPPIDPPYLP